MTSEQSRQIVLDAWKAFASQDPVQAAPFFAEDAEWIAPPDNATAVALGGLSEMKGRQALAKFVTQGFRKLYSDVSIELLGVYADGETVVVEERMRAKLPNGRLYDNVYCLVFKLENGLIKLIREYMDTLGGERMIFGGERAHALAL